MVKTSGQPLQAYNTCIRIQSYTTNSLSRRTATTQGLASGGYRGAKGPCPPRSPCLVGGRVRTPAELINIL